MADVIPAGRDPAGLRNQIGSQVNPATEDTLQSLVTAVSSITSVVALTPKAPESATIGTTPTNIKTANASRKSLYIINLSTNYVSLGLGVQAELYKGVTIPPMWFHLMKSSEDLVTEYISAISSGAGTVLSIQEYI